tara:strand:- start:273 stop:401 length:129 start_codon:yes stop_codon:yes gene_type:complete
MVAQAQVDLAQVVVAAQLPQVQQRVVTLIRKVPQEVQVQHHV